MNATANLALFKTRFAQRAAKFGFPGHMGVRNLWLKRKVKDGVVGLFMNDVSRHGSKEVIFHCASSISYVQTILEKTEIYRPDGGLTWTFGILLRHLRDEGKVVPSIPSRRLPSGNIQYLPEDVFAHEAKFGWSRIDIFAEDTPEIIDQRVEDAFGVFETYGWPFLDHYGSEEGALNLALRTDDLAEICFLPPKKPLVGLLLAQKLRRADARDRLFEMAYERYKRYASYGNGHVLAQFERVVKALDLA